MTLSNHLINLKNIFKNVLLLTGCISFLIIPRIAWPQTTVSIEEQAVSFVMKMFCDDLEQRVAAVSQGSASSGFFRKRNGCGARYFTGANYEFTFYNARANNCEVTGPCNYLAELSCKWAGLVMAEACTPLSEAGTPISGTVYFKNGKPNNFVTN